MSNLAQKAGGYPRILYAGNSGATATGSGEKTLFTYTVPANTFIAGKGIKIRYQCRRSTGSGTAVVTTKFGGTRLDANVTVSTANWIQDGTIIALGSGSQRSFCHQMSFTNGTVTHLCGVQTFVFEESNALDLTVNCTLTTSTDVITLDWIEILWMENT